MRSTVAVMHRCDDCITPHHGWRQGWRARLADAMLVRVSGSRLAPQMQPSRSFGRGKSSSFSMEWCVFHNTFSFVLFRRVGTTLGRVLLVRVRGAGQVGPLPPCVSSPGVATAFQLCSRGRTILSARWSLHLALNVREEPVPPGGRYFRSFPSFIPLRNLPLSHVFSSVCCARSRWWRFARLGGVTSGHAG